MKQFSKEEFEKIICKSLNNFAIESIERGFKDEMEFADLINSVTDIVIENPQFQSEYFILMNRGTKEEFCKFISENGKELAF